MLDFHTIEIWNFHTIEIWNFQNVRFSYYRILEIFKILDFHTIEFWNFHTIEIWNFHTIENWIKNQPNTSNLTYFYIILTKPLLNMKFLIIFNK